MSRAPHLIRVLHLLGTGQPGGIETFIRDVVTYVDSSRFELSVCVLGNPGPISDQLVLAGVDVSVLGNGDLRDPSTLAKYVSMLRRKRPQILHANTGGRAHKLVARMMGTRRSIAHFHALPVTQTNFAGTDSDHLRAAVRRAAWNSDVILACSSWLASVVRTLIEPDLRDVRHLSHGIAVANWSAGAIDRAVIERERAELRIPNGAPVVGFVGRFVPQKGVPSVLETARRLQSVAPSAVFVLVGGGPLESFMRELARNQQLSNVRFAGSRVDPRAIMSLFDVTVMPSEWEPFGIVALESMALGKPVVCSRTGGLPEAVVDGETGIIVPVSDVDAFTEAVLSLIVKAELRDRFGRNGQKRITDKFDIRDSVNALESMYESLMLDGLKL